MRPGLPSGGFIASYRLVSADSHVVDGTLRFVVGSGALPAAPAPPVNGSSTESMLDFARGMDYSGIATVAWVEEPAPGSSAEPEHPAPTLQLAPAQQRSSAPAAALPSGGAPASRASSSSGTAVAALAGAVVATALAATSLALAWRTRRAVVGERPATGPPDTTGARSR
jgi:hypothetical protein